MNWLWASSRLSRQRLVTSDIWKMHYIAVIQTKRVGFTILIITCSCSPSPLGEAPPPPPQVRPSAALFRCRSYPSRLLFGQLPVQGPDDLPDGRCQGHHVIPRPPALVRVSMVPAQMIHYCPHILIVGIQHAIQATTDHFRHLKI